MSDWVIVAKADELLPGDWRVVDVHGAQALVCNLGGRYYAIEDV
jgi:nitrite reductase/ring-hydroxylating ferredoxin subunit